MSQFARAVVVILISAWSVGTLGPRISCIWQPCPQNGLNVNFDGGVTHVDPGSPAADAGIARGDRILMPLPRGLSRDPPIAHTFYIERGGVARRLTLNTRPIAMTRGETLRLLALAGAYLVYVLVGSALLLLRPSAMTWSFYLYSVLRRYGDMYFYWPGSAAFYWANALLYSTLGGATCALVLIFALRFPRNEVTGWRRPVQIVAIVLAVLFSLGWLDVFVRFDFLGLPSQSLASVLVVATSVVYAVAAGVFLLTLFASRGDERQRLQWIVVFPVVLLLRVAVINIPRTVPDWFIDGLIALAVLVPLAVAYAVVRRRVFDVQFVISRALVYGSLTSLVAGMFLLIDWFMTRQFAQTRFTLSAEIVFALALGSSLNLLHRSVDRFVDGVFFRQRHFAERRLAKAAMALTRAENFASVDQFVVHEPVQALGLTSAALFRKGEHGGFLRRVDVGWSATDSAELTANDPLVLYLLAENEPVRVSEISWRDHASHLANSVLMMPVLLRDHVVGIAFYGPHATGADIDPDEQKALSPLLERAGAAYDHIDANALRAKVDLLTRERDAKEREIARLRGLTS